MERARTLAPYDYVINHDRICKFRDKHFAEEKPPYTPSSIDFPHVTADMELWLEREFPKKDRPKCLVLYGPSRTGKTEWARALGHILAKQRSDETGVECPPRK
jgi:hypothetical protein